MVTQGDFTVEVVDARLKRPFVEYNYNKPFVLLKNGDEYYIRVSSSIKETTMCMVEIDGHSLGYTIKLGARPSYCGHWSFKDGQSINRSLRYYCRQGNQSEHQFGYIDVHFHEALSNGREQRYDTLSGGVANHVSSRGGLVQIKTKRGKNRDSFTKGKYIRSISLGYHSG
jgi:hypothetical protein